MSLIVLFLCYCLNSYQILDLGLRNEKIKVVGIYTCTKTYINIIIVNAFLASSYIHFMASFVYFILFDFVVGVVIGTAVWVLVGATLGGA